MTWTTRTYEERQQELAILIATVIRPNRYNNQWIAQLSNRQDRRFDTRAEAVAYIKEQGAQLVNNREFHLGMLQRDYVASPNMY